MAEVRLKKNENLNMESVVYFNQRTGAPHAGRWSKSLVSALIQAFSYFSVTNGVVSTICSSVILESILC